MNLIRSFLICISFIPCGLSSMDVIVHIPDKGAAYLQVKPEEAVMELKKSAEELLSYSSPNSEMSMKEGVIEVMFADDFGNQCAELPQAPIGARDYNHPATYQNAKDIKYIVTTLANKPPVKLLFYKSSLDRAGDRIDRVHPFRFLQVVFTDEEMKVGIRNIRRKGWVWKEFIGGLKDSLNDEYANDNLFPYIDDFASTVGVNPELIRQPVYYRQWDELVKILIENVPRSGDTDRYDI